MDYIAGELKAVDADLRRAGFEKIGEHVYRKGSRRVRWISSIDKLRGIDGHGRKFISRFPFDHEIEREARGQQFTVTISVG